MFKNAIVRRPSRSLVDGITSAPELGKPNYELALKQHDDYIKALEECGVKVTVLQALEEFPDSCFVEDTAVLTPKCAIISNPGALSRQGESPLMVENIKKFYNDDQIEYITSPGTMEGGDVMMVGNHFYIGLSARTNEEGCRQFKEALAKYGHTCSVVSLEKVLHLKTGVNYVENNNMLVSGEFIEKEDYTSFNKVIVPESEAYGANCIWVNDTVIVAEGYPTVEKCVRDLGYKVIIVDTSEFRKLDGGLSCLSLRF
ncbi:MAG: N(G),N(G)-dimethylarginine dimethylaminohydrolase [Bacillota bacterium]|nr:N(G),N(G)-dimethylarginine dimethylaminohydrolase [Bacillota bacterium]